jgi:uncharacterized protein YutE (UPF0331/DUF86 family)
MGELLLRKALQIRDRIRKLRGALPANPEDVRSDERLESFISFQLFLLIQDAIDLATHLIAARGLALPGSQREVFEALAEKSYLRRETGEAMAQLASLRNRIAHTYGSLDPVRLVGEAPIGLEHVERMLDELAQQL